MALTTNPTSKGGFDTAVRDAPDQLAPQTVWRPRSVEHRDIGLGTVDDCAQEAWAVPARKCPQVGVDDLLGEPLTPGRNVQYGAPLLQLNDGIEQQIS